MEKVFENDMTLTPGRVAHMAKNNFRMPGTMLPFLKRLARKVKERIRLRRRKKTANSGEANPRRRSSATEKLLAEGTYSLNVPLAETARIASGTQVIQPTLPGLLDEPPSLDSKRRIEDYEALIAPYQPLLAEVASMEVLDEVLRLLYEGGDAPSVVGWSGKTSDCEYKNLREHKHFLDDSNCFASIYTSYSKFSFGISFGTAFSPLEPAIGSIGVAGACRDNYPAS